MRTRIELRELERMKEAEAMGVEGEEEGGAGERDRWFDVKRGGIPSLRLLRLLYLRAELEIQYLTRVL